MGNGAGVAVACERHVLPRSFCSRNGHDGDRSDLRSRLMKYMPQNRSANAMARTRSQRPVGNSRR